MKKVAIVGLGWLGMPLALSLTARGWQVTGSKTTQDGVEAARMCGIDSYPLRLEPQLVCDTEDLDALMNVDALVITLPARRTGAGEGFYLQAVQEIVDTALAYHIPRIVFTSSTSVYGNVNGTVKENSPRLRKPPADRCSRSWRTGCTTCRGRRWIFCAWPGCGAFPSSGTFFRRQVGAGWPARGQSGAFAGCGGRYRTAAAGPEGRAHL